MFWAYPRARYLCEIPAISSLYSTPSMTSLLPDARGQAAPGSTFVRPSAAYRGFRAPFGTLHILYA